MTRYQFVLHSHFTMLLSNVKSKAILQGSKRLMCSRCPNSFKWGCYCWEMAVIRFYDCCEVNSLHSPSHLCVTIKISSMVCLVTILAHLTLLRKRNDQ